eukprot:scaffold671_cov186-Ochromonas_danica.AAC.3
MNHRNHSISSWGEKRNIPPPILDHLQSRDIRSTFDLALLAYRDKEALEKMVTEDLGASSFEILRRPLQSLCWEHAVDISNHLDREQVKDKAEAIGSNTSLDYDSFDEALKEVMPSPDDAWSDSGIHGEDCLWVDHETLMLCEREDVQHSVLQEKNESQQIPSENARDNVDEDNIDIHLDEDLDLFETQSFHFVSTFDHSKAMKESEKDRGKRTLASWLESQELLLPPLLKGFAEKGIFDIKRLSNASCEDIASIASRLKQANRHKLFQAWTQLRTTPSRKPESLTQDSKDHLFNKKGKHQSQRVKSRSPPASTSELKSFQERTSMPSSSGKAQSTAEEVPAPYKQSLTYEMEASANKATLRHFEGTPEREFWRCMCCLRHNPSTFYRCISCHAIRPHSWLDRLLN